MRGRSYAAGSGYRYGFQKQEKDDEIYNNAAAIFYKYRMYDARLGRFLSTDPLETKYPFNSPFAFSQNRVIDGIELEGLEVWLIGKQESAGVFLSNTDEIGVAIAPNGVYAYASTALSLTTSVSVASQMSVTWYPKMPKAQNATGWTAFGGVGVGGVLFTGSVNIEYCSGYLGINGTFGIGGSYGLLGDFTAGAGGSYTWIKPLSELAKREDALEILSNAKKVLNEKAITAKNDIHVLSVQNMVLSKQTENLKSDLKDLKNNDKIKAKIQSQINSNNKAMKSNTSKITEDNKNLNTINSGINQLDTTIAEVTKQKHN